MTDVLDPPKVGLLNVLDGDGDMEIDWTHGNEAETTVAEEAFNRMKSKGYWAYEGEGDDLEVVHRFNPAAEHITMKPQRVGG